MAWLRIRSLFQHQLDHLLSKDKLGKYPQEVYVSALEGRRALWMARMLMIGLCSSLMVNIALAFALASLTPLKRVEPMLLTLKQRSDQIVHVEPFHKTMQGFDLLVEQMIKDYVLERESVTIHPKEMEFRWSESGIIAKRSDSPAFHAFQQQVPLYRKILEQGITRNVAVTTVTKVAPQYWTVEFETIDNDTHTNHEIGKQLWQATLMINFLPKQIMYDERFMNPLGFTVIKYSVTRKK